MCPFRMPTDMIRWGTKDQMNIECELTTKRRLAATSDNRAYSNDDMFMVQVSHSMSTSIIWPTWSLSLASSVVFERRPQKQNSLHTFPNVSGDEYFCSMLMFYLSFSSASDGLYRSCEAIYCFRMLQHTIRVCVAVCVIAFTYIALRP